MRPCAMPPAPGSSCSGSSRPDGVVTVAAKAFGCSERRGDEDAVAGDLGVEAFLLEGRLLHQPVHEAAQQQALRAAALLAPRPQPGLVGEQLRDPALAGTLQDEQRPVGDAGHQHLAVIGLDIDLAEPAAPGSAALGLVEAGGDRMAAAEIGERRREAALEDLAGRPPRQDARQRRAVEAHGLGELRPRGLEQGTAVLDIAGDVLEIDQWQEAAARVAVENDEIELVELDLEQLARREGDQRQLANRRAVLLFRRAQDGEMHQIDRRVGLQEVAPHPQAPDRAGRRPGARAIGRARR